MKTEKFRKVKISITQVDGFDIGSENVFKIHMKFLKSMKLPEITIENYKGTESQALNFSKNEVNDLLTEQVVNGTLKKFPAKY